jgi:hypothetical protein
MMDVARATLLRRWRRHLPPCLLAFALAVPAAAQQSGEGGIVTERLEPLGPVQPREDGAESGRDSRFKRAPFRSLSLPAAPELIEPTATVQRSGAQMRQLDKMTGRTQTFEIAVGTDHQVDRLRVRLEACRAPEDNAQHGTMAFVEIWDSKRTDPAPVFSGWMFAESPALSAMDHPRYDVWVISCTTSAGEASAEKQ